MLRDNTTKAWWLQTTHVCCLTVSVGREPRRGPAGRLHSSHQAAARTWARTGVSSEHRLWEGPLHVHVVIGRFPFRGPVSSLSTGWRPASVSRHRGPSAESHEASGGQRVSEVMSHRLKLQSVVWKPVPGGGMPVGGMPWRGYLQARLWDLPGGFVPSLQPLQRPKPVRLMMDLCPLNLSFAL